MPCFNWQKVLPAVYLSCHCSCCFLLLLLLLQVGVREVIQGWDLGILGTEVSAQLIQGTRAAMHLVAS
jgi:hypothetical protein